MTQILIFTKSAASVVWWQFAYTPECYEEWSDELQLIAKSLFAKQINWIPPKNVTAFQPCHKRTSWPHASDSLVNTGVSVDEDKAGDHSVMLMSLNNRLDASKGGCCLESLFFLCQPWLPALKHVPSSLLCTKRASQLRILLPVRWHLNQPFIISSRTSRRAVQLLWRRLQGTQESPASARTVS